MPKVEGFDKLMSFTPHRRVGMFCQYGSSQSGFSSYGDDDLFLDRTPFGVATFGDSEFADILIFSGIYRSGIYKHKLRSYRNRFYIPSYTNTPAQATNRGKLRDAVVAWQALTSDQKNAYNQSAKRTHWSGYGFFLHESMSS